MSGKTRLGVNIDHVATLRRLRDTPYPSIMTAAREVLLGGADQITVHLREDRRHIVDADVLALRALETDLNLEMAATPEMLAFVLALRPHSLCLVPERREERTTEGGLDLSDERRNTFYARICSEARAHGIVPTFFIEPRADAVALSKTLGAQAVELHTGQLCLAFQSHDANRLEVEWHHLQAAVSTGVQLGIRVHAGHGIDYDIAPRLRDMEAIEEYNIGHSIVCEAVFCGLREATRKMKALLSGS